jgi:hypothetical protein
MNRQYQTPSIIAAASGALLLIISLAGGDALAQRARTISDPPARPGSATLPPPQAPGAVADAPAPPPPANMPKTVKAKYEGGIFGYNKKQTGTLNFDDESGRLVFRDKTQKEYISIPYKSIAAVYSDTKSARPMAATVIGSVPSIYALPARFIRKKSRYLTMQFSDPDTRVSGVTSFKMDNKELLETVLAAIAHKAELTARGEAYVRLRQPNDKNKP